MSRRNDTRCGRSGGLEIMEKKIIELTDREKFIAHYLSTHIVGIMNNQSDTAIEKTVYKLKEARSRHLSEEEADLVIRLLTEEFVLSGSWLAMLNKDLRNSEDLQ